MGARCNILFHLILFSNVFFYFKNITLLLKSFGYEDTKDFSIFNVNLDDVKFLRGGNEERLTVG